MAKVAKRLWKAGVMTWCYDMMTYDMMMGWRDDVMAWWRDDVMTWWHDVMMSTWHDVMMIWHDDMMTWWHNDMIIHSKSWSPWRPSRPHCTNASPSFCRRWFVFNINTSHIDLLFLTNWRWKTRICVIYAFLSHFFVAIHAFFPPNRLRQFIHFKNVWTWCHDVMMTWRHDDMVLDPWSWSYAFCLMYTGLNAPNFETTTGGQGKSLEMLAHLKIYKDNLRCQAALRSCIS